MTAARIAECHPKRQHKAHGMCESCYGRSKRERPGYIEKQRAYHATYSGDFPTRDEWLAARRKKRIEETDEIMRYKKEYDAEGRLIARIWAGDESNADSWRDEYDSKGRRIARIYAGDESHDRSYRNEGTKS